MEKELNIAEILKGKIFGTELWSDAFGALQLGYVTEGGDFPINVIASNGKDIDLTKEGHYFDDVSDCLPCIYPSRNIRDWSKFAWKKGDVLASNNNKHFVVFKNFSNKDYTMFKIAYVGYKDGNICSNDSYYNTADYHKASKEDAKEFIKSIEEQFCGKLNIETLEIEKPEPQFKDGDIMYMEAIADSYIFIFNKNDNGLIRSRVSFSIKDKVLIDFGFTGLAYEHNYKYIRPATEEEKQQLFSALEKEGKAWDAENKAIVDLPKKCEFKPFDKVLVKHEVEYEWMIDFFSHYDKDDEMPFVCMTGRAVKCIPYNDKTAHLLGTNDDYEEGGD